MRRLCFAVCPVMRDSNSTTQNNASPSGFARLLLDARFLRVAAGVYLGMTLLVWSVLLVLCLGSVNGRDRKGDVMGPDFRAFYTAGWMVRHGESARLYDFDRQQKVQELLEIQPGAHNQQGVSAYLNPPHFAAAMAPLSALPYPIAFAVWSLATLAAFCAVILLLKPFLPSLQDARGRGLMALAIGFMPIYFTLSGGQNTGFSLLLFTLIFLALERRRDTLAGLLVALGLLKPQLFLGLLPLLFLAKRPRALFGFAIGAGLTWIWTTGACGAHSAVDWMAAVRSPFYQENVVRLSYKMFSWQAFWRLLLGANTVSSLLGWSFALAVFLWLCVLWRQAGRNDPGRDGWLNLYALTLGGTITMVPHLFVYDLGLLVFPMLVWADRVLNAPSERFTVLRLCLLALFAVVIVDEQAQITHFQFATPLLMLVLWLAWRMNNGRAVAPRAART